MLYDYNVWFREENGKDHKVKVKSTGIIPAVNEAVQKLINSSKTLTCLGWDIWKVEQVF